MAPALKMWQAKVSRPLLSGFVFSFEEGKDMPVHGLKRDLI